MCNVVIEKCTVVPEMYIVVFEKCTVVSEMYIVVF